MECWHRRLGQQDLVNKGLSENVTMEQRSVGGSERVHVTLWEGNFIGGEQGYDEQVGGI